MIRNALGLGLALLVTSAACDDEAQGVETSSEMATDSNATSQNADSGGSSGVDKVEGGRSGSDSSVGQTATGAQAGTGDTQGAAANGGAQAQTTDSASDQATGMAGMTDMTDSDDAGVMDTMPPVGGAEAVMDTGPGPQGGVGALAGSGGAGASEGGQGGAGGSAQGGMGGAGGAGEVAGTGGTMMGDSDSDTDEPDLNAACLTLQRCCEERQGEMRSACERVRESRDFGACRGALAQYCGPEQPTRTPPACVMLGVCCATLGGSQRADCDVVVSAGDAMVCEVAATSFCDAEQDPPSAECAALQQCCDSLQDGNPKRDCQRVRMAGDSEVCRAATIAYCPGDGPGGPRNVPPECVALSACCAQQTDDQERQSCEALVEQGEAGACRANTGNYCQPRTPEQPDPTCMELQACCETQDNLGNRAVCEAFALSGDAMTCERERGRFCEGN